MALHKPLLIVVAGLFAASIVAGQTAKKPLDHDVYDSWRSIGARSLSDDGKWLAYTVAPQVGDGMLYVKRTNGGVSHEQARGSLPRFSHDQNFVLFNILPAKADVDKAKKDKKKPDEMPKNAFGILDLATGKVTQFERLKSFRLAEEDSGWCSYQVEPEKKEEPKPPTTEPKPPTTEPKPPTTEQKPPADQKPKKKPSQPLGSELILRELATGKEIKLTDVYEYQWTKDGRAIVYTVSTKTGEGDGLYLFSPSDNARTTIYAGFGNIKSIAIHADTKAVAFLTDKDTYSADKPTFKVFLWQGTLKMMAEEGAAGLPKDWQISDRSVRFSDKGKRLFFATGPKPAPEPKDPPADDEKVTLDVWNWKDPLIQPMQLVRAAGERSKTYEAFADIATGKLTQLETPDSPSVSVGVKGDGDLALGTDDRPYRLLVSWDQSYSDVYLFNLKDGTKKRILEKAPNSVGFSPSGKYAVWFDDDAQAYFALDTSSGVTVNISKGVTTKLTNELNDVPASPNAYGSAGWTDGEAELLVYDSYDVWALDPKGRNAPRCVTDGFGRRWHLRLRPNNFDAERGTLNPSEARIFSAFDTETKASGFYRGSLDGKKPLERLVMEDKSFAGLTKAKNADVLLYTRKDFDEYPDLWVNDLAMKNPIKLTDANPQQKDYNWGTAELVEWTSNDGVRLQGVLCKPENFEPGKKYPMVVYFYERLSDTLHSYYSPGPGGGSISPSFYCSRGYLVFQPDIPYRIGYPGWSALSAILPGVQSLIDRGYVNPKAIGMNGYSWGGYQIAYMVTQTNLFACGMAGAPVSNMVSAYGGIRWDSGMVREFQYEKTQSRIGGTLWEKPLQFVENSPIFWADKVQTPLLIQSNDADGAVPWYQGIEYFTALRRLGKPVWMLNYNGEGHGISKRPNQKDFAIRQQQFYDHYLMGAPMPIWMEEGVPAALKGKELGLGFKKKG